MTREEAIDVLSDFRKFTLSILGKSIYAERCSALDMAIEALSADAVQGEWICKEREYNDCDGYYAHYWYECSVCGARPPKNQWKNEWHSNYCPSCGARMKGGAE